MKRLPMIPLAMAVLAAVLVLTARGGGDTARAAVDTIVAGHDLFETDSSQTFQDFAGSPVPGAAFDAASGETGCDDFADKVFLEGVPFDFFGGFSGLDPTDTIVERLQDAVPTFPDTIPIEIVALQLRSVSPITVTGCSGGDQSWDLEVQVPEGDPDQVQGTMTIRHEFSDGGTFDSQLPVVPKLTFTRLDGPGAFGPVTGDQIDFTATDVPWCHTANPLTSPAGHVVVEVSGLTSNFFPGITCQPDPDVRIKELTVEQALFAAHGVLPAETVPGVGGIAEALVGSSDSAASPADSSGSSAGLYAAIAGIAAAALTIAAGGWYARRRLS